MGHGDETNYLYVFKSETLSTVLEHLAASLENSGYNIDNAEVDRAATIDFQGKQYVFPIYAIHNNHFSENDGDSFRPEKDLRATLKPGGDPILFDSGVWCKPDNILDEDQAERTASKGKKSFRLTHFEVQMDLGAQYARLKLRIWGGMYWGGTESDPSFSKLVKPLKTMCDVWIIEDETGAYCNKPKMNEEMQEQFGEYYQENDYFEDEDVDRFAKAVLEYEPED